MTWLRDQWRQLAEVGAGCCFVAAGMTVSLTIGLIALAIALLAGAWFFGDLGGDQDGEPDDSPERAGQ